MQQNSRWLRRLTFLSIALALLGVVLWAGWYVYNRGFTRKWRAQLSAELRRRGLDFEARRLTLNPFEGLVAEDAHLYLLDAHHTPVLYISRVAVDISIENLIEHKPFLNSLDLRGARLTIPVDTADPDGPKLRLRRFQAKLSFQPEEVKLTQAQGDFYGLQISASGALLHPKSLNSAGAPPSDAERAQRRKIARAIVEEVGKVHADRSPPTLEIRFQGDLAKPSELRASAVLQGEALRRGSYRVDRLLVRLDYGAAALHLQQAEVTDARGTLSAQGDFSPAAGDGRFHLQSNLDLVALGREFAPAITFNDVTLRDPPRLQLEGHAHFATPAPAPAVAAASPQPAVAPPAPAATIRPSPAAIAKATASPTPAATSASVASPAPTPAAASLALTGHLALGEFNYRTLRFTNAETDFSWSGDRWYLHGLRIARPGEGDQQITGDVLSEPSQFKVRLTSTLDPEPIAALLQPERARAVFSDLHLQTPPHISLTAAARSFADLANGSASGQLSLGHVRFRGVGLNRLHGDFSYEDHVLSYKHFTLERDEGTATGDSFVFDMNRNEVRLDNVRATVDPAQVCVWIDPDVAKAVAPYRFHKPPATVTNGVVQLGGGRNSALTVDVNSAAGFSYVFIKKTLNFQNVLGQVFFNEDHLRLNDLRAESFGGQVLGSLELSLGHGPRDYTASVEVKALEFAPLTKLYFDYNSSNGQLSGVYHFTGRGDDPRTLHGAGNLSIDRGNVFAIPFLGPLSGILNTILPGLGFDVAHQGTADFLTSDGKIYTGNLSVKGAGFNLFGGGWLGYVDNTMNFRVRINSRGLPGAVLYPVSKLFEYSSQGPLNKPVWRPRVLAAHPPTVDNAPASPPPPHLFPPESTPEPSKRP
jgi:hypothetical protein